MNKTISHSPLASVALDRIEKTCDIGHSIIYETGYTGHRSEYLSYLMKYISRTPELCGRYTFVLNEKIEKKLGYLKQSEAYNIEFIKIDSHFSNSIERSFEEWKMVEYLFSKESMNFTEIIFLDLDPFLILITSNLFKRYNLAVKGILFEPYYHYKERRGGILFYVRHTLRSYLIQKYATYANTNIQKLFILNDEKCVPSMNKKVRDVFHFLPDPIDDEIIHLESHIVNQIKVKYAITPTRKNLLLFGSIDCRKNLITIINSLLLLPSQIRQSVHLIIAGKIQSKTREQYLSHIRKHSENISITCHNEFVTDEDREVLFQHCDIVLMPYTNFYSSSGVLGHAIKHNKLVVASNTGLVARLVKENGLGITVDPSKDSEIRDAIISILSRKGKKTYTGRKLLEKNHPYHFCRTLLH